MSNWALGFPGDENQNEDERLDSLPDSETRGYFCPPAAQNQTHQNTNFRTMKKKTILCQSFKFQVGVFAQIAMSHVNHSVFLLKFQILENLQHGLNGKVPLVSDRLGNDCRNAITVALQKAVVHWKVSLHYSRISIINYRRWTKSID